MKNSKYVTLFFFFLGFIAFHANSQTDFTLEQLKSFNRQKLSLELEGVSMGSYSYNIIAYSTWTKWSAYKGFDRISESEFYKIAGYEDLAYKAKKRENSGKFLTWSGLGMGVGGCIIMLATMDYESDTPIIVGALTSIVGFSLMYGGIGVNASNLTPYSTAHSIADEYNLGLTITIKKKF